METSLALANAARLGDTNVMLLEWNDARTAALFLKPCTPKHLNEELGVMLNRKSGNGPGARTARSGGWLYHRHDLERVRAIMDALGAKPLKAAQIFHALKELNRRQQIAFLTAELDQSLDAESPPRKFQ